ncbi:MAG: MBL fold metallo-hydrolase [Streptosporangiaceae bacterium]|jgi:glyoxylase-like metal-dependent hydrolase (beta-lactamase superfamily II)
MNRLREMAPGVLVATAALYRTNTTVVTGDAGCCLVIDPAVTPAEISALAADLDEAGLRPEAGFATHPHWDHLLWSRSLGDVPRYATPRAVRAAAATRDILLGEAEREAPGHDARLFARLTALAPGASAVPWPGPEAVLISHDGHAPGHCAVFLPATGTLVAGDMCSDTEIPLLDTGLAGPARIGAGPRRSGPRDPAGDYRTGLAALAAVPGVRQVIPGHGSVGEAAEFRRRIAADLAYLDGLERGEPGSDPRLSGWLRDEDERQRRRLHPAR